MVSTEKLWKWIDEQRQGVWHRAPLSRWIHPMWRDRRQGICLSPRRRENEEAEATVKKSNRVAARDDRGKAKSAKTARAKAVQAKAVQNRTG